MYENLNVSTRTWPSSAFCMWKKKVGKQTLPIKNMRNVWTHRCQKTEEENCKEAEAERLRDRKCECYTVGCCNFLRFVYCSIRTVRRPCWSRRKSLKITVIKAFATSQIIYIHLSFSCCAKTLCTEHMLQLKGYRLQYECGGLEEIRISSTVVCNWFYRVVFVKNDFHQTIVFPWILLRLAALWMYPMNFICTAWPCRHHFHVWNCFCFIL